MAARRRTAASTTPSTTRIYTLPDPPPPIYVPAAPPHAAELAGRLGDEEVVSTVERAGGVGKPKVGMAHCWAATEEDVAEHVPHGPDPGPMLEEIRGLGEAGFTHVYVHQIGSDQQGFLEFAQRELLPNI
jgi:hypothetical protein